MTTEHNDNITVSRELLLNLHDAANRLHPFVGGLGKAVLREIEIDVASALEQPAVEPEDEPYECPVCGDTDPSTSCGSPTCGLIAPQAQQPAVEPASIGIVRSKSGGGGVFVQWNEQPKAGMQLYTAPQAQQEKL